MNKHKVFVNGINVYDGDDPQRQREVLDICQKVFRVTGATANVEVHRGPSGEVEIHQYIGGSLFSDNTLGVSVADGIGTKDRMM